MLKLKFTFIHTNSFLEPNVFLQCKNSILIIFEARKTVKFCVTSSGTFIGLVILASVGRQKVLISTSSANEVSRNVSGKFK